MIFKIPIDVVPIENDGFHLLFRAEVCNNPINMIIDTGASKTIFDSASINELIKDLKVIPNEEESFSLGQDSIKSYRTIIPIIKFGELKILDFNATLIDLNQINKSYEKLGLPFISGILGSDILVEKNAIINFKEKILLLEKSSD